MVHSSQQNTDMDNHKFGELVLWLVWLFIVFAVLGASVYLFVGGSMFFKDVNSEPIIIYTQIKDHTASLTGNIPVYSKCDVITLTVDETVYPIDMNFTTKHLDGCHANINYKPVSRETFYAEIRIPDNKKNLSKEDIHLTINGEVFEVILK